MTLGFVIASLFWIAYFVLMYVVGSSSRVEQAIWNWLEHYCTENKTLSWFAPFDFEELKEQIRKDFYK